MKKLWMMIACFAFFAFVSSSEVLAEEIYNADKVWTITFTSELNPDSINSKTIYIKDASGKKLDNIKLKIDDSKKRVFIDALNDYKPGQYTLHITDKVKSKQGKYLKATTTKSFTIAENAPFSVVDKSQLTAKEKQLVENWEIYFSEVVGPELGLNSGAAVYDLGQSLYVVTTGIKPTGGFDMRLQKTVATSDQVNMYFEDLKPVPGQMVTDAITFPYIIMKSNSPTATDLNFILDDKSLKVKKVPVFNPRITVLDLRNEFVVVSNSSSSDVDLSDWTLVSTVGDQSSHSLMAIL